jgi:hypothetical protein
MSRASRARSRAAASSRVARCSRSSACVVSRATYPTLAAASSMMTAPVTALSPTSQRVYTSQAPMITAAVRPSRRPPCSAHASTGPACHVTGTIVRPSSNWSDPTITRLASTNTTETARSAQSTGHRFQPGGRAYR